MAEKVPYKSGVTKYDIFEINEDKLLFYNKNDSSFSENDPPNLDLSTIYIINSKTAHVNKRIIIPFNSAIEIYFISINIKILFLFVKLNHYLA